MMDTFLVLTPGPYMTVQDKGRFGYQQMGIPISGALDPFAFRVANLLVGNPTESAVLEITIMGPQLAVLREVDIALTGAEMGFELNYDPVESWKTIRVKPGDVINIQQVKSGCRGYLAVSGGFDVPEVMGSCSTYVSGKLGGYKGRPLKKGDIIRRGEGSLLDKPHYLSESWIPRHSEEVLLRAIPGPQDDFFDEGMETFFQSKFMLTAKADRMGYRLQGPPIQLKEKMPKSIISEPTMPGGVQIPADGQPIILLAEQTVGGYTKIATVISSDLSRIAQAIPGDTIQFEQVSLETAQRLYHEELYRLQTIAEQLSNQ
jgi:biotin-dependent carboxylase-like uncharacterized protein